MRLLRAFGILVSALGLSGCGFVHFGRLPKANDPHLVQEYAEVSAQRDKLQKELALTHREHETLLNALQDASAGKAGSADMARQLEATTRELASVRADYAKLKAERAGAAGPAHSLSDQSIAELQQRLTAAQQDYTRAQQENVELRRELENTRIANASLAQQLKSALSDSEQTRASLAQLNTDLLAQKQARADAEQASAALRAQLDAVVAQSTRATAATAPTVPAPAASLPTSHAEESPASDAAKEPAGGALAAVELHTSATRNRPNPPRAPTEPSRSTARAPVSTSSTQAPVPEMAGSASPDTILGAGTATPSGPAGDVPTIGAASNAPVAAQTYVVQKGDTLEKISLQFYGSADQWGKIYAANVERLSASQGLKAGMQLDIPPK